jgi:hypothetical protein
MNEDLKDKLIGIALLSIAAYVLLVWILPTFLKIVFQIILSNH